MAQLPPQLRWPWMHPWQMLLMANAQQQRWVLGEGSGEEQAQYEDEHLDMNNLKSTKVPVE